jgi:hypothetical protein
VRLLLADETTAVMLEQNAAWGFPNVRTLRFKQFWPSCDSAVLLCILERCGPKLAIVTVDDPRLWRSRSAQFAVVAEEDESGCDHATNRSSSSDDNGGEIFIKRHAYCFNSKALTALARAPALRTLAIEAHVMGTAIRRCLRVVDTPYRQLRHLAVRMAAAEVPLLTALLARCAPLAEQKLQIIWNGWPPVAFVAWLAQLEHLRVLRIVWVDFGGLASVGIAQPDQMTDRLQKLMLEYEILLPDANKQPLLADDNPAAAILQLLELVDDQCRQKVNLDLEIPSDIAAVDRSSERNVFPNLTKLHVLRR